MITSPRFVALYVNDQDRAVEFWSKTIGFDVQLDVPYDETTSTRWIEVKPPNGDTYIVLSKADDTTKDRVGGFSNVWFQTDDLDKTYEDLKARSVEFPVSPETAPWDPSQRWAQFSDPDGNLYGLS